MKQSIKQFCTLFPVLTIWSSLPAFTGWLSLSAGILCSNAFPMLRIPSLYNYIYVYAIILSLIIALVCKNSRVKFLLFFVTGFAVFSYQKNNHDVFANQLKTNSFIGNDVYLSGKVISPPLLARRKHSFLLKADKLYTNTDTLNVAGKIYKCTGEISPPPYGTITCSGRFSLPKAPVNPHAYNERSMLYANNIAGRFKIDSLLTTVPSSSPIAKAALYIRATVLETITHVTNPALQGILQAVFLGEKNNLTGHIKKVFRDAGIYHLLAISGLHVAILISSVWLLLSLIPVSRIFKILATILFIWCYLFFIGFIPSLFRAVIMATLILLSTLFQRNNHVINALGVAGIIWLVMSPFSLFTPGFQLSFAATFGIVTLFPIFNRQLIPTSHNEILSLTIKTVLNFFYVSLAGFIATLPIIAYHFGRISLFGLLANIFAVFLMGFAMNTFFIGIILQMIWQPLAVIAMRGTEFFLFCINGIAELSTFIPWASIDVPVPYFEFLILFSLAFLGFTAVSRQNQTRYIRWTVLCLFCLVPIITFFHSVPSYTEITFFSTRDKPVVGIRFPNRKIWLIQPAEEKSPTQTYKFILQSWLRHHMIKKIDAVVAPAVGRNIIYDLNEIGTKESPASVISGAIIRDNKVEENLTGYLNSMDINHIKACPGWQFIPSPSCTATIDFQENRSAQWYEKPEPAVVRFSCNGVQFIYNASGKTISSHSPDPLLQVDNCAVLYSSTEKQLNLKGIGKKKMFLTEEDGAVIVRIDKNGSVRVRTML